MRTLLACLLPVVTAAAQTFVVDAANGPGTDFTDLQTAASTVPDGAVLHVRGGQYASFTITAKSLTVLCDSDVNMFAPFSDVTITGLNLGQRVVIRGLATAISGGLTSFVCQSCSGEIVLDHVAGGAFSESRLQVTSCTQVVVDSSFFATNGSAAEITSSDVTMAHCSIASGHNAFPGNPLLLQPALVLAGGRVQLTSCHVFVTGSLFQPNPPAVLLQGGTLRADGGTYLQADSGFPTMFGHAIDGTGTARLTADVVLAGASPLIAPTVAVTTAALPSLNVQGDALGSTSQATLTAAAGLLGVAWIGFPGPAFAPFPSGDPVSVFGGVILGVGATGAPILASVAIPSQPTLVGLTFGWQGLTIDAAGTFELTNAWPFVIH